MSEEVKEFLEELKEYANGGVSGLYPQELIVKEFVDYVEQLQQENKELKETLKGTTHCFDEEEHQKLIKENEELKNKIDGFNLEITKWLENSKAEMHEYGDNHEKYWELFNQLLRKFKSKLIDNNNARYSVIDSERLEELINMESISSEFEAWLKATIYCLEKNKENSDEYKFKILTYKHCLKKYQELKKGREYMLFCINRCINNDYEMQRSDKY